jgi:hypothetical protein
VNNVRPTTDPEASAALRDAIDEVARQASDLTRDRSYSYAPRYARPVKPISQEMFSRLQDLARELGYTTSLEDLGPITPWSAMHGITAGWPFFQIRLNSRLDPRTAVSTYGHEISHILLGHNPRTEAEVARRRRGARNRPIDGDPGEEAACELAAAAMVRVLGIGDGRDEADFIKDKLRGQPVPQNVRDAALLAARVLWTAVGERRPRLAA